MRGQKIDLKYVNGTDYNLVALNNDRKTHKERLWDLYSIVTERFSVKSGEELSTMLLPQADRLKSLFIPDGEERVINRFRAEMRGRKQKQSFYEEVFQRAVDSENVLVVEYSEKIRDVFRFKSVGGSLILAEFKIGASQFPKYCFSPCLPPNASNYWFLLGGYDFRE